MAHPRGSRSLSSRLKSRRGLEGIKLAVLHEQCTQETLGQPAALSAAIQSLPITLSATRPLDETISTALGSLGGELGVRAEAARPVSLELDAFFFSQHTPYRVIRHAQRQRQRAAIPAGHALWRRQLKLRQDSVAQPNAVLGWLARPGFITKSSQAALSEPVEATAQAYSV